MLCSASLNYFPMKRPTNMFSIIWKRKQRLRYKINATDSVNKIKADLKLNKLMMLKRGKKRIN